MSRDVRLVASDLDGTLLEPPHRRRAEPDEDGEIYMGSVSTRTRGVLDRLEERGIELVAVTGRPPRWVRGLGIHSGVAVCSNGAVVVDLESDEVLAERVIAPDVSAEVVRRLRHVYPEGVFAIEFPDGVAMEEGWARHIPSGLVTLDVGPAEILVARPAAKVLMRVWGQEGDDYIDAAVEAIGDLATVTASGGLQLIEVSAVGVDKATTLELLCDERRITAAEVVAFGDARNDLPMLTWAGTGVAMADAHPTVLAAADAVCPTNADDGVAEWLETHVLP